LIVRTRPLTIFPPFSGQGALGGHVGVRTIKQERMVTLLSKRSAVVKTKLL
jgi:hypothetical protein